ncbi:hypothetical protein DSO57_1037592 [Entomophthora muscae]|uniref:Uncharacterized protein n=1 Tax=Entomophthora muscae TaxID=34485 RepID=A0ACC2UKW0_9FUNG|nr:hypothetical protein DSO57_1037592 [Entomophthora muscae]
MWNKKQVGTTQAAIQKNVAEGQQKILQLYRQQPAQGTQIKKKQRSNSGVPKLSEKAVKVTMSVRNDNFSIQTPRYEASFEPRDLFPAARQFRRLRAQLPTFHQ